MGKVIIWLVVIFGILFVLRLLNVAKSRAHSEAARKRNAETRERLATPMVRCERCGVFLPKAEAVSDAAGYHCADPGCADRR